jgi:hypothetical protein
MKLTALLGEIERSSGPIMSIDLARRLGVEPGEVAGMVSALRASGRLGPEAASGPAATECASSGACSMSCPGPGECSLTIDLSFTGPEVRRPGR